MLNFTANRKQYDILECIAYWNKTLSYYTERYGLGDNEIPKIQDSIELAFEEADKEGIPFWVQNNALMFGNDWRFAERNGFRDFLNEKGITEQPWA